MPGHFSVQIGYVVQAVQRLMACDGMQVTARVLHESTVRCVK